MQLLQAAILFLEQFQNGRGGTALAGQEPDFHATETQVGGQSAPVIPSDTVGLQQHLQLLKELWGQPGAGNRVFTEGRFQAQGLDGQFNPMPHTVMRSQVQSSAPT